MQKILLFLLALTVTTAPAFAQNPPLVKAGATPRLLCGGFRFVEGPAAAADGDVYFTDIPNNTIRVWTAGGELKTYRENSDGANGLAFDRDGTLLVCEGGARRLVRDDLHGTLTVLADAYAGKKLNSPNDLWLDAKDGVYFTDPRYGQSDDLEQDQMAVYYLPKDGPLERVADGLVKPNGIVGTPDGKTLYVADEGAKQVYAYTILKSGKLAKKRLFTTGGADGLALDEKGNLYLAAATVQIFAPDGALLEEISFPEHPTNLCFGGKDGKTLFVAARTSLYSLELTVSGAKQVLVVR